MSAGHLATQKTGEPNKLSLENPHYYEQLFFRDFLLPNDGDKTCRCIRIDHREDCGKTFDVWYSYYALVSKELRYTSDTALMDAAEGVMLSDPEIRMVSSNVEAIIAPYFTGARVTCKDRAADSTTVHELGVRRRLVGHSFLFEVTISHCVSPVCSFEKHMGCLICNDDDAKNDPKMVKVKLSSAAGKPDFGKTVTAKVQLDKSKEPLPAIPEMKKSNPCVKCTMGLACPKFWAGTCEYDHAVTFDLDVKTMTLEDKVASIITYWPKIKLDYIKDILGVSAGAVNKAIAVIANRARIETPAEHWVRVCGNTCTVADIKLPDSMLSSEGIRSRKLPATEFKAAWAWYPVSFKLDSNVNYWIEYENVALKDPNYGKKASVVTYNDRECVFWIGDDKTNCLQFTLPVE